jgi:hypothetical protein
VKFYARISSFSLGKNTLLTKKIIRTEGIKHKTNTRGKTKYRKKTIASYEEVRACSTTSRLHEI